MSELSWKVANRDSWDVLYQESVSYYWNVIDKNIDKNSDFLFDIYKSMGVSNISKDKEGVVFYGDDESQQIVKIIPNFTDSATAGYISGDAYTKVNGWSGLRSKLTIKIPNSVLLDSKIVQVVEAIDFDKLDYLCGYALGKDLVDFFSFRLPKESEGSIEAVKVLINSSFSAYESSNSLCSVKIPELLTLLGILDAVNTKFQSVCDDDQVTDEVGGILSRIDSAIYKPLTTLLSSYVSLGLFFPFGFNMSIDANKSQMNSLAGLRNNVESSLVNSTLKSDVSEQDFANAVSGMHGYFSQSDRPALDDLSQDGDRGGASGLTDDYAWEQFVPRMVAYNWHSLRDVNDNSNGDVLEDNTSLKDYKRMLYNLGFKIPDFTDIVIRLEENLPYKIDGDLESSYKLDWNYSDFISSLEIAYPTPPECSVKPMALCDLIARRANEPFTSF